MKIRERFGSWSELKCKLGSAALHVFAERIMKEMSQPNETSGWSLPNFLISDDEDDRH